MRLSGIEQVWWMTMEVLLSVQRKCPRIREARQQVALQFVELAARSQGSLAMDKNQEGAVTICIQP